ncbi:hypothetical protein RCL1_004424 [Eukaryota sp. TZLM3-RCL]
MTKFVYTFGEDSSVVNDKALLGGKGVGLAAMMAIGIPVPPGFTITTAACNLYQETKTWPAGLNDQVIAKLAELEKATGKQFGNPENPLLVSVRSGAKFSMPGMMDTVLNLGLNDITTEGLAKKSGNERFAYDSYRRFMQMFGNVVMEMEHHDFEHIIDGLKKENNVTEDTQLTADNMKELCRRYRAMVNQKSGNDFPQDPKEQLDMAINAVFKSWGNPRAVTYRKLNNIPHDLGTAVNVQAMVFGNMGDTSGTGVCFTRNPSTGEKKYYGEYLKNAQGEDVVAGIRTPSEIEELQKDWPEVYGQLTATFDKLETHFNDMQDVEFTIEEGRLYLLQTRSGKRTAFAAVRIAVEMVREGILSKEDALLRVEPNTLNQLLHPQLNTQEKAKAVVLAKGLPASPGAATGRLVFTAEAAVEAVNRGEKVILVRLETSPDDIQGMHVAQGILTARGGMTSHAAVVARGMGKCCVAGCSEILVDAEKKQMRIKDRVFTEENWITLDGGEGKVFEGRIPVQDAEVSGDFAEFLQWCREFKTLGVRTNAETKKDCEKAIEFGAEGIGLARTEHMFFEGDRIIAVREMILAEEESARRAALDKLLPYQIADFEDIYTVMKGLPTTIRLLDPPLHEFLPHTQKDRQEMADQMKVSYQKVVDLCESLHEFNPMLGFRGCRLGMIYPEINEMQVRAIFEAACNVMERGIKVQCVEVMIPVLASKKEMKVMNDLCRRIAAEVMDKRGVDVPHKIGVMIELPRACVIANQIAEFAEFFSFGTNDLTQTTFGYSRDDAGKFIGPYIDQGVLEVDPFQAIDTEGVGELMRMAVIRGRRTKSDLYVSVCGEQGGEPSSVEFCHCAGLTSVSCSPFRVPIALLSAAQAAIKEKRGLIKKFGIPSF